MVSAPVSAPLGPHELLVDGTAFRPDCLVYGLVDPREPGRVRYVGKTERGALYRYVGHLSVSANGRARAAWIAKMIRQDRYPQMVLLERTTPAELTERERWWILAMQAIGQADTNAPAPDPATQAFRDRRAAYLRSSMEVPFSQFVWPVYDPSAFRLRHAGRCQSPL